MTKPEHPCLSCPLPDCDDSSRRCNLRQAMRDYDRFRQRGERAPDDVRRRNSMAYTELYGAVHAESQRRRYRERRAREGGAG